VEITSKTIIYSLVMAVKKRRWRDDENLV